MENMLTLCVICHAAIHSKNLDLVPHAGNAPPYDANYELKFVRQNGWKPE